MLKSCKSKYCNIYIVFSSYYIEEFILFQIVFTLQNHWHTENSTQSPSAVCVRECIGMSMRVLNCAESCWLNPLFTLKYVLVLLL